MNTITGLKLVATLSLSTFAFAVAGCSSSAEEGVGAQSSKLDSCSNLAHETRLSEGARCNSSADSCRPGLRCVNFEGGIAKCATFANVTIGQPGEACDTTSHKCALGLTCSVGKCAYNCDLYAKPKTCADIECNPNQICEETSGGPHCTHDPASDATPVAPPASDAAPVPSGPQAGDVGGSCAGFNDAVYCGLNYVKQGDPTVLYRCSNGVLYVVKDCKTTGGQCIAIRGVADDYCSN